ncbi:hypothetical protein GCM10010102_27260 [Promicromonospora citrea]|uniref:Uncharacterized protein n=1 Tax=Promicromonospora citrea TaxID=43677 RepID=A0A8H9L596_9MICO|nr:hypothetical protein GCM10010102_27260 [Promicromonospora citrea]
MRGLAGGEGTDLEGDPAQRKDMGRRGHASMVRQAGAGSTRRHPPVDIAGPGGVFPARARGARGLSSN